MKRYIYYIAAAAILVMTFASYPFIKEIAAAGRRYYTPGGEPLVLVFGVLISLIILGAGFEQADREEKKPAENPVDVECGELIEDFKQAFHNFETGEPETTEINIHLLYASELRISLWRKNHPNVKFRDRDIEAYMNRCPWLKAEQEDTRSGINYEADQQRGTEANPNAAQAMA